jgi:conjugative transposon TraM protein
MNNSQHPLRFLKQRKFMMVLPLLVLPFVLIIFLALGGGKGSAAPGPKSQSFQGINLRLPDAHFKKGKQKDKLGFYEDASRDSLKRKEALKKDPYFKKDSAEALQQIFEKSASRFNLGAELKNSLGNAAFPDSNEEKLVQKLSLLKQTLTKKRVDNLATVSRPAIPSSPAATDLTRLENTMRSLQTRPPEDPELTQLAGMLDKILLIQHPEKFSDSLGPAASKNKSASYSVSTEAPTSELFADLNHRPQNAFYGCSNEPESLSTGPAAMEAVIDQTQTLVPGAIVTLRLLQNLYIHGAVIPRNTLIYGSTRLNAERLTISVQTIRHQNGILPVSLQVYDLDGLEGIYVPGSINREVGKESAAQGIGSLGIESLDPSLGAQAASAGIQAAKTLMSKKIRLVRLTLEAGYKVFLIDQSKK